MKKLQQLLCLLLAVLFCLALFPASALAEDADADAGAIKLVEEPEPAEMPVEDPAPDIPNGDAPEALPPADEPEDGNSGKCGDNLTWSYDTQTGVLTITGTGDMYNFSNPPWVNYNQQIISVKLPDGLTTIGDHAFADCHSLKSVNIPEGLYRIGNHAFFFCESLTNVNIPDGTKIIGDGAFSFCDALTSVTIPSSVTIIGNIPFKACHSLKSINVEDGNTEYYSQNGILFDKEQTLLICCPGGKTGGITIPESVTKIVDSAFYGCENLTAITIPSSVTTIELFAFRECENVSHVEIPASVAQIGKMAFASCSGLQEIYFYGAVPEIVDAFYGVNAVAYYPADDDTWTEDVRQDYGGKLTWIPYTGEPRINVFTDVQYGKYYYEPVLWAYYHDPQITGGISETEFGPSKTCTREQIVTFLWKAMGAPEPETTVNPFEDVKSTKYYYKPVLWAVEKGITGGMDATHFGVGKPCTREQAMTFLWKAMGAPDPTTDDNPFLDVPAAKYYYKAVLWAVENGITSGVDQSHFGVGKSCTRGQIVTFLYKAMEIPTYENAP